MSATDAKQQRKQARKVIGAAGLNVLGQHSQDVRLLMARVNELEALMVKAREAANAEYSDIWVVLRQCPHPVTFAARLKWLLTGR